MPNFQLARTLSQVNDYTPTSDKKLKAFPLICINK
jgi:hypothetical protein